MVMEGGGIAYYKNGETYSHGFTGGGLVEAVEGDPQAVEAAETYQGRMTGGVITYLVGLACGIGGIVYSIRAGTENDEPRSETRAAIFGSTMVCFLAGAATGVGLMASAQPYQYDAINIYNDNMERRYRAPAPAWPAPPLQPVPAPLPRTTPAPPTPAQTAPTPAQTAPTPTEPAPLPAPTPTTP